MKLRYKHICNFLFMPTMWLSLYSTIKSLSFIFFIPPTIALCNIFYTISRAYKIFLKKL